MNLKELKEIIDLVTSRDAIDEFEIEKSGVRLRIKRAPSNHAPAVSVTPPMPAQIAAEADLFYIKSPFVGTFYRTPSPQSDPYVSPGDVVEKGTVVCIIEAMKLMNEVESEVAGEIVTVLVENGHPVEFGEKLFAVRPR